MDIQTFTEEIKHGGFKSFIKRALELGVKTEVLSMEDIDMVKLSHGATFLYCYKNDLPLFRRMGNLTRNKGVTKMVLEDQGIRTPRGIIAESAREALKFVKREGLQYPLIAKPLDGSLAKGVTWNVRNAQELEAAIQHATKAFGEKSLRKILVEEMFAGREFRVLVFNGRVLSCVEKIAAGVTGDGTSDVQSLISAFNKTRLPGFEIKVDAVAKRTLKMAGLSLASVLPAGTFFKFRNNLNMSDGGRCIDRTQEMHPSFNEICVRAVATAGLTYGGLDLLAHGIAEAASPYVILEVNPNPFYNMHEKPLVEGEGVDVSQILLEYLFPALKK